MGVLCLMTLAQAFTDCELARKQVYFEALVTSGHLPLAV